MTTNAYPSLQNLHHFIVHLFMVVFCQILSFELSQYVKALCIFCRVHVFLKFSVLKIINTPSIPLMILQTTYTHIHFQWFHTNYKFDTLHFANFRNKQHKRAVFLLHWGCCSICLCHWRHHSTLVLPWPIEPHGSPARQLLYLCVKSTLSVPLHWLLPSVSWIPTA